MPCQPKMALQASHGAFYYPSSTIYAPQITAQSMGYFTGAYNMLPACSYYSSSLHASHPAGPAQQAQFTLASADRIHAIQQSINSAAAKLKQDSSNVLLQNEMAQLRAKLNIMLDSAVKRATPFTQQKQTSTKPRQDDTQARIEPKSVDAPKPPRTAIEDVDKAQLKNTPRNAIESHISAEHTCSSCGTRRSKSFHATHPYTPGQKPVHNVCKACRVNYEDVSVMRRYHFCYSCGIVRSKTYQRRHAYEDPSLHTRNFCSKCAKCYDPVSSLFARTTYDDSKVHRNLPLVFDCPLCLQTTTKRTLPRTKQVSTRTTATQRAQFLSKSPPRKTSLQMQSYHRGHHTYQSAESALHNAEQNDSAQRETCYPNHSTWMAHLA